MTKEEQRNHINEILNKIKETESKFGFKVEDVTPEGYGPTLC